MGICKKCGPFPVRYVIVVLESKLANSPGVGLDYVSSPRLQGGHSKIHKIKN